MSNLSGLKKGLVIFLILFFVLLLLLLALLIGKNSGQKEPIASPTPIPVPTDFNTNYSKFDLIIPGKSTADDVEKINGFPSSLSTFGNHTILNYQTPSKEYKNTVVIENNVVKYAVENVFGTYRGKYSDYTNRYGQPDMHLYNSGGNYFDWYIFLKQGVGIENSAGGITRIIYFIPQSESSFIGSVAKDLGLLKQAPTLQPGAY